MPIKTPCATCQTPDAKIPKGSKLPNRNCLIRQCVDKTGVENCAYCSRFPCDAVKATGGAWNRKDIEKKLGAPISEDEYHAFVEPFEGIRRLETIHASLRTEKIAEPTKALASENEIVDFPENLPFLKEETASFKAVHRLLTVIDRSSLGLRDTDTFAQHHKLEDLKQHVLRFLWILGCYGVIEEKNGAYLVVDARTYLTSRGNEKRLAVWSFVQDTVLTVLSDFGVRCERVALKGVRQEDLTTGTGYLRTRGWVMKMSFEEDIGGLFALEALQNYARRVDKKHGKRAFQRFREVDMQVLFRT